MGKVIWYLKQLFPLTYRSHFENNGRKFFAVWRMWFGHVFYYECWPLDLKPGKVLAYDL